MITFMKDQRSLDISQIDNIDPHDSMSPSISKKNSDFQPEDLQNNSILGSPYEHKMLATYQNTSDQVIRNGEKIRQNNFVHQDASLNNRNKKINSQTVVDCFSDYSANRQQLNMKDLFEENLHKFFDQNQNSSHNINTQENLKSQYYQKMTMDQLHVQDKLNRLDQNKQDSDIAISSNEKRQRQHMTKHSSYLVPSNSSQKEITISQNQSVQQESSFSGQNGNNNNLNQQFLSRVSQKHSSYAISYSSNQNGSNRQISHKLNESSTDSHHNPNKNLGRQFIPSQNMTNNESLQKIINKHGLTSNDISIMNIPVPDMNSNKLNALPSNISQPQYSNVYPQTENMALLELRKKRQTRMSIVNQGTTNKFSFKFFKKANLIKKFMQNMISVLSSRVYEKLELRHFRIIGDYSFQLNSHHIDNSQNQGNEAKLRYSHQATMIKKQQTVAVNFHRAVTSVQQSIFENIPIFQPNSTLLVGWNIFMLLFLLLQLSINPLLAVFEQSLQNDIFLLVTGPFAMATFIVQIILNLNTGFYNEGDIVKSRLQIFKKYFRFYMWLDLITLVFIVICMSYLEIQYLKMIYIIRVLQVFQLLNNVEEHFQLQQKYYTAYELTKLFALVFFVAHYCGCLFYFISKVDYQNNENQESWIKKYNVATESWDVIYLDSLYFSFITMVTVGFGDIVPISSNEKIYVIMFSIVSCGIFGYAVNTIGSIFHELSQKQANYKLKKFEITQYMEGRNIQRANQIKVLKYLEYMNSQEEERNFLYKGELILNGISKHLREEVQQDFFGKILLNSVIFKNVFTNKLIEQLSLLMKEITLGPGDIIFNNGDDDNRLYYVFKGQVENTFEYNNRAIKFGNYLVGDFFGQTGFFADIPRQFTAKSKGTTHIVYCKREDMLKLIQENPLDLVINYNIFCQKQCQQFFVEEQVRKEAFSMIKDEILFKENICGHKCLSCMKTGHIEKNCNYINMKINKPYLYLKNNYSVDQYRNHIERNIRGKYNSLKKYYYTKKLLKQLRVTCVLEAVDYWDDLAILQDTKLTDKEFYMRMPKIKCNEIGQLIQETDDSLYSDDEEMLFFSKDDVKDSQVNVQLLSENLIPQGLATQKQNLRIVTRHNTHKVSIKHDDQIFDKPDVMRSKTKKDTQSFQSPTIVHKQKHQIELPKESSSPNIAFPQGQQDKIGSSFTIKTRTQIKRQDSNGSVNEKFNRNASRNMSLFGTVAANGTHINLNAASTNVLAKDQSETKIESPRQRSNLSAFNPKSQENKAELRHHTQIIQTHQQQQELIRQNQQFEEYFNQYDIENDFEKMKEYTIYYPQNNLTQILRSIRKNWLDKFSKKRWKTRGSYKTTQKSKSYANKIVKSETKNTQKSNTNQQYSIYNQ